MAQMGKGQEGRMTEERTRPTDEDKRKAADDLLYLCVCALHGLTPQTERIREMRLPYVYRLSRMQELSSMSYMALETADLSCVPLPDERKSLLAAWREQKEKAVRKAILQELAETEVEQWLDESGIWYLPLKGVLLKTLYPRTGMRQMLDVDILFDSAYRRQVKQWFVSHGYEVEAYEQGNHDLYTKKPALLFEMHVSLYNELHQDGWSDYYENVRQRLLPTAGSKARLQFSAEDFYVFLVSHAYKHYQSKGTGLRALFDVYVYLRAYREHWDAEAVRSQLRALGIAEFESLLRSTAEKLCATPAESPRTLLTGQEAALLADMLDAGAYGTVEKQVKRELEASPSKGKYWLRRLFPPLSYYREQYPFFYRHKLLLPFCFLYRVGRGVSVCRKRLWNEWKAVKNAK